MAPKAPPDPKNPSLVSLSQSLIQGCIESDTRVHIREHEQAEHMSFGLECVRPDRRVYIRFQSCREFGRKRLYTLSGGKELIDPRKKQTKQFC